MERPYFLYVHDNAGKRYFAGVGVTTAERDAALFFGSARQAHAWRVKYAMTPAGAEAMVGIVKYWLGKDSDRDGDTYADVERKR